MNKHGIKALMAAIDYFGGHQKLADYLGVHNSNVSHWLRGRHPIALHHAESIDKATKGVITTKMLRPDIYQYFKEEKESI